MKAWRIDLYSIPRYVTQSGAAAPAPAPESVLQAQCLVLSYQAVILGVTLDRPVVELVYELRYAANLNIGIYGVTGLVDYIALASVKIVLHAGRLVDANRVCITEELTPVGFDRPTPLIAVSVHGVHEAEVVYHHTAIALTDGKRKVGKGYGAISAELELATNPMFASRAVTLPSFVVDTDEGI